MPNQKLYIILVPGLDDGKYNSLKLMCRLWNRGNVVFHTLPVGWRDGGGYPAKIAMLLELIDQLTSEGKRVALIGISAGGSLVVNAYALRPQLVGIISVCGALRLNPLTSRFARSVNSSPAFRASAVACQQAEPSLGLVQRQRILVMRPLRDGIVPLPAMKLIGSKVQTVLGFGHVQSIITTMLFYRRSIMRFLQQAA